MRVIGLALCSAAGGNPEEGLDRLAGKAGRAPEAAFMANTSPAQRSACRQRLLLDDTQRRSAQYLDSDALGLAEALRRAGEGPLSIIEGRSSDLLWALALAPSRGESAELRVGVEEFDGPDGHDERGAAFLEAHSSNDFLLALWQVNDRFHLAPGSDDASRRLPWICGDADGRRLELHIDGSTVVLSEGSPDGLRTRLQRCRSHELVVLYGASRNDLRESIADLRNTLMRPRGEGTALVDIAAQCAADLRVAGNSPVRAAIVAGDHADLGQKLDLLERALQDEKQSRFAHPRGVWAVFAAQDSGKLAFLFPGQGAQYFGMLAQTALYLDPVRHWLDLLDAHYPVAPRPSETVYGPPGDATAKRLNTLAHGGQACLAAALALSELLESCGARPDFMVGHSNGENAAIVAAMSDPERPRKAMLGALKALTHLLSGADEHNPHAVGRGRNVALTLPDPAIRAQVLTVLAGRGFVSIDNCPSQLLVHLMPESADGVLAEMAALGVTAQRLAFDPPFHTPLFAPHAAQFAQAYAEIEDQPMRSVLYSAATAAPLPADGPGRRATAAAQWTRTVRFRETTRRLYDDGARIFVDVGAAGRLAGFVRDTLRTDAHSALACDAEGGSGYTTLLRTLGQLFVLGKIDNLSALFDGWLVEGPAPLFAETAAPAPVALALPAAEAPSQGNPQALFLVQRHFALMREFIDSQSRVMNAVIARSANGTEKSRQRPQDEPPSAVASDPLTHYAPRLIEAKPGELRWEVTLDLKRHGFLGQHSFGNPLSEGHANLAGLAVSPLVFSIEMCAAAARRANGGGVVTAVADCLGYQWAVVAQASRQLRLEARREDSPGGWAVRLCGDTGEPLFACRVELAQHYPPAPLPLDEDRAEARTPSMTLEAFNAAIFHGEGYRAMRAVRSLGERAMSVEAEVPPFAGMIAEVSDAGSLATPAPLLDTFGQLAALFALQSRRDIGLFPVAIERIAFFAPPAPSGRRFTVRACCQQSHELVKADVDFIDAQGTLAYRVIGAENSIFDWGPTFPRIVFSTGQSTPFAAIARLDAHLWYAKLDDIPIALLTSSNGLWLEVLARCLLGELERAAWRELAGAAMARKVSWLLGRIAAKSALLAALRDRGWRGDYADIIITNLASGAPEVKLTDGSAPPALSISHCDGCAVALVATAGGRIGIDVEPVDAFEKLGHLAKEIVGAAEAGPTGALQQAGLLRLWCAKEAAAKAAGTGLRGRPGAWLTRSWTCSGENWTAEVLAPPDDGGQRYTVTLFEHSGWMLAIAREGESMPSLRLAAGSEQQGSDAMIGA